MNKDLNENLLEVRIVIFSLRENHLSVLLLPSEEEALSGCWELPKKEYTATCSLETLANDRLKELMGGGEFYLEQLYTYGDLGRHPEKQLISVVFFALIPSNIELLDQAETNAGRWFAVEELPTLAMDHGAILEYALVRLRYKLEYSAVGFELLPEFFTLSELQHTYELILGVKLDKRNFRRRILEAGIIESTSHRRMGEGRPAQLYRYRPDAIAEVKARRLFP